MHKPNQSILIVRSLSISCLYCEWFGHGVWNLRNLEKDTNPLCYFNNGKKSSVTSVSFSSFNPVLLASSSMDETLTFYDVN